MKTEMPDPRPTELVDAQLTLELLADHDRFSNGSMLMRMADTSIAVSDDDGNPVGEIGMAMGGTVYWKAGRRLWAFNLDELVRLGLAADEAYLDEAAAPTT